MKYIAHIKSLSDRTFELQNLTDHLNGTAEIAAGFAAIFNNSDWGKLIGLWHDLGKYSDKFQEYIKVNSGYEEDDQKMPKTDHTSAAAILAKEIYPTYLLSLV
jgi:CRISPR-associated endonuclease/helicase Cas3